MVKTPAILSVMVVDDEAVARDVICRMVEKTGKARVTGRAGDVAEAWRLVSENPPDLVLLDIEMPGRSGFELARLMSEHNIDAGIIFVTAYDQYAIEAIRHAAFDYLLKPVDEEQLNSALDRFRGSMKKQDLHEKIDLLLKQLYRQRIRFNTRNGFFFLNPEDILYIQAEGAYSEIHTTTGKSHMVSMNLLHVMAVLPAEQFARINRSVVVNREYIAEIHRGRRQCHISYGSINCHFPVTATYLRMI